MCGIAGIFSKRNVPPEKLSLLKMGGRLHHRGPDNSSFVIRDNSGFVHTRLSILDVTDAANQPFTNSKYVLCYNGEIYNYQRLKKDLLKLRVEFKTTSDTEVLFYCLIMYGVEKTLKIIEGMFAFSFYDTEEKTLFLCRDHFGIKPIYWTEGKDGLYWASEVKAFLDVIPVELDPIQTINSVVGNSEMFLQRTLFKGVKQIPPGSYLKYSVNSGAHIKKYFNPVNLVDKEYYKQLAGYSIEENINQFEILFEKSISSMLMSDVPVGAFVSGGIDSSLIAVIAKAKEDSIKLFTANIVGKFSEHSSAVRLAEFMDSQLFTYEYKPEMLLRDITQATYHNECPIITFPNSMPLANVAKMAKDNYVKPVLTGEGSDELFLGYHEYLNKKYLKVLRIPAQVVMNMYSIVPGLRKKLFPDVRENLMSMPNLLAAGFEDEYLREESREAYSFLDSKEKDIQALSLELLHKPLIGLLHRNDRMGMMASIESRFPFLDLNVVKFAVNLPYCQKLKRSYKIHNIKHPFLVDKYFVRKFAGKYLPKKLTDKKKWQFVTHGLRSVNIREGFFKDGFIEQALSWSKKDEKYLFEEIDTALISRLGAVEIFAQLFDRNNDINHINERIKKYFKVIVK